MMIEVRNNNLDRALRVLKRKLAEDGMFRKLQEKQHYEKPSEKRNRKMRSAITRQRKADKERKDTLYA